MQSQGDTWVKHRKISQLCHLKKWIAFLTYTSDFSFLVSFPCLDCQHLIRMPTDSSYPPDSVSQRILEREGNWIQYSFICTYSAWDTRTTPSYILGFPGGSVVKNPPAGEARDVGLIPVLGRSPGVGKWQPTLASLVAQRVKHLPAMRETGVWSLGREDPVEKEMATHSSILAWRTPRMEEPGRLQSTGSQRVRHNWATSLLLSYCIGVFLSGLLHSV